MDLDIHGYALFQYSIVLVQSIVYTLGDVNNDHGRHAGLILPICSFLRPTL